MRFKNTAKVFLSEQDNCPGTRIKRPAQSICLGGKEGYASTLGPFELGPHSTEMTSA
jgi:hypothetical protein